MNTLEAVQAISPTVLTFGGSWFFDPATRESGTALGFPNAFAWYVSGRGGVLGDVDASVVASAFCWFSPTMVEQLWALGAPVMSPRDTAHRYAESCAAVGRAKLSDLEGVDRLAALTRKIIDGVEPMGDALFSGWRAEPVPSDAPGAAMLNLQCLRELRGDAHIHAAKIVGLGPLENVIAKGGAERAKFFQWPEPYPDPAPFMDRHHRAEAFTDEIMCRHYEALTGAERAELVRLIERVQERAAAG